MKLNKKIFGFTLVELLVVISIMGILTIISLASFTTAQVKSRDSQRKSDLNQVSKALLMYYSDTGSFPAEADFKFGDDTPGFVSFDRNTIYMRKTPKDPINKGIYVYKYKVDPITFKSFNLFANLENIKDSQCIGDYTIAGVGGSFCYGIASPNIILKNW